MGNLKIRNCLLIALILTVMIALAPAENSHAKSFSDTENAGLDIVSGTDEEDGLPTKPDTDTETNGNQIIVPPLTKVSFVHTDVDAKTQCHVKAAAVIDEDAEGTLYVEVSENEDMSGAKTVSCDFGKEEQHVMITGLKPDSQYFLRARRSVTVNNLEYYSEYTEVTPFRTAEKLVLPTVKSTRDIYKKVKQHEKAEIDVSLDSDDAHQYMEKIKDLYPYYISPTTPHPIYSITYDVDRGRVNKITLHPMHDEIADTISQAQVKIDSIVKIAKKKKTKAARIKYINRKIKKACEYDWDKNEEYRYIAYGCLCTGYASCMGYAESFKWCMDELGIKNKYRFNKTRTHVWNQVYIKYKGKKRWWNVDVTWNDTSHSNNHLLKKKHG